MFGLGAVFLASGSSAATIGGWEVASFFLAFGSFFLGGGFGLWDDESESESLLSDESPSESSSADEESSLSLVGAFEPFFSDLNVAADLTENLFKILSV